MYYAILGSDMGYLRDLMMLLFGEEEEEVFAEGQFGDIPSKQHKHEANAPTEETGELSGKKIYTTSLPIPMELSVPSKDLPKCDQVLEKKDKGNKIMSHSYYFCNFCSYKNRNRTTAVTHIHRDHLQNKLCCCLCSYLVWSADPLEKHTLAEHDGKLEEGALTEQEVLNIVKSLTQ